MRCRFHSPADQTLSGLAGSPAYAVPEVPLGNYSEKVDIWSANVSSYMLCWS
jgi:serine/threonine protein kinase